MAREGDALADAGRLDEAVACYRTALAVDGGAVHVHCNLGNVLARLGRIEEAERSFGDAIAAQPGFAEAHFHLGNLLKVRGRLHEAEACYRRAIELKPDFVQAHNNRGIVMSDLGRWREAEESYRATLTIHPHHARAHHNLGNLLRETGRHEDAETCYREVIRIDPSIAEAHYHLGNSLLDLGRLDEAEDCYRRALAIDPALALARSNYLLFLNYVPRKPAADILFEHRRLDRIPPASHPIRNYANIPDPQRKLKIGYVSADFRVHSVAHFIRPILENQDGRGFDIHCYYNFPRRDEVTEYLRTLVSGWRDVHALSDDALAELIRGDAIDILVDLSGHTSGHRLRVFARGAAPVQVTYLGYPSTTGISAIDYRITDPVVDPHDADAYYTERLIRLPHAMWCYAPDPEMPEAGRLPALSNGGITFGSFNYFAKINGEVIATWAELLARIPSSRLVVTRIPGPKTANAFREQFRARGISAERLELHGILPRAGLRELFTKVDIALDTFPYAGTTTTCDVLWMGIPVVTLAGDTGASRSGASLLRAVRLGDLVASSMTDYVDTAARCAADRARLARLRDDLRARMRSSTLIDAPTFTRNLEAAYFSMWKAWCSGRNG